MQAGSSERAQTSRLTLLYTGDPLLTGASGSVEHTGAFLANAAGLDNIECATVEACCGSGGGVLRWGYMAVPPAAPVR
ncbi:hypothetical protein T492DRAFT_861284 [Pavlovales sp. CCMP2436]|nr:hypothetical protein T492DRAFT_861284 [Pavlovales sp. CCMP2436]